MTNETNDQDMPLETKSQNENENEQQREDNKETKSVFVFTEENFRKPDLPSGLSVIDVPLVMASDETLRGFGKMISSKDELTVEKGNFEIKKWPVQVRIYFSLRI